MSQTQTIENKSGTGQLPASIFRHWIHSREEDRGDIAVYRPREFTFPPSFGRDGFEIRADGRFVRSEPGPADGLVRAHGHWQLLPGRTVAVTFANGDHRPLSFAIVGLDGAGAGAVLRVRFLTGQGQPLSDDECLAAYAKLPSPTSARLIDFARAEVITLESFPPQYILSVSGVKPYLTMAVDLVPVVYIRQPEFWEIEVVGRLRGIGLPALAPYTVTLPLAGATGKDGIEVVGATRRERLAVPPGGPTGPATE